MGCFKKNTSWQKYRGLIKNLRNRCEKIKADIRIYDYVDRKISVLAAMYKKRLIAYRVMGYKIKDDTSPVEN